MPKTKNTKYQPFIIAFASLILFVIIILQYTEFYNDSKEKNIRANLYDMLITKKSQLEKSLNSRIYYTKGIAAYTSIHPEITDEEFRKLADELIDGDSVISTMALSKDCIISSVYPLKNHEEAIGLNLLAHSKRKKIVDSTIRTKNTFVAGPVELVEGGIAFLSYTPIFVRDKENDNFWGVTDIVIWKEKLFNEIKLVPIDDDYKYALRGIDGSGNSGDVFFGEESIFDMDPVLVDVILPTGKWVMACIPIDGWNSYLDKTEIITIILYISAVIISFLILLLTKAMIKIRYHEKELEAIFNSMDDLIIEFNRKGEYVKIAPTNDSLLVLPREKMIGKSIKDIFSPKEGKIFLDALDKCFETKEMVIIDYPLTLNSKESWFEARISYQNENSLLYIAHDNTIKKNAEEKLKQSEKQLRELNTTKDKLFSIIAHDLRSPFNSTMGLTEILQQDYDTFTKDEIHELLEQIQKALKGQLKLLENLLNWAQLQTNKMSIKKELIPLKSFCTKIVKLLETNINAKSIELRINFPDEIFVQADKNMLRSIIQNLLTNAIKFTKTKGSISISATTNNNIVEVQISDTGVGIPANEAKNLFNIDYQPSRKGTEGEQGTGLGLAIVNEMIEKHNGKIWVESEIEKGSRFTFSLPINK